MTFLHLDFESRSQVDIHECGLDRYAKSDTTEALMLGWAVDEGPVNLWEKHIDGEFCSELKDALSDPHVVKPAFNAPFERAIFKYVFRTDIPAEEWLDVLVWARHMSVTGDLGTVGKIFGLNQDEAKIKDGERLIAKFCSPAIKGGEETLFGISKPWYHDWETDPEDWQKFGDYCKQDVIAERALLQRMQQFPLPEIEQQGWILDQKINERGLMCDLELVRGSIAVAEQIKSELRAELKKITGVDNPNSDDQIKSWLKTQGYTFSGIGKPFVNRALDGECELTPLGRKVLEIRKQFSKTSDSKLEKIIDVVSEDGRLRNQFSYMGAARTGRWSGHTVQVQNLPRPVKAVAADLENAITLLKNQDHLGIAMEFPHVMDVVTSTLRSIFVAAPGKKLLVCDLNAVEFRVLGWITGCDTITDVFRQGLCPYKTFAVDLFGKPYDLITKEERQEAKPGVLGGGYQLSGGEEVINEEGDKIYTGLMGYGRSLGVELPQDLAHASIKKFREKYFEVTEFWKDIENAGLNAVRTKKPQEIGPFVIECFGSKLMRLMLPSGRGLHYIRPKIEKDERFGKDGITYEGRLQQKKVIGRLKIYGGKWVENGDQSFSRDLLLNGMFLAEKKGLNIIGHTHDELIAEVDKDSKFGLDDLKECMIRPPTWAPDLILGAEGFEAERYRKD